MRISTGTIYDLGIFNIQRQQADLLKVQQQVSTGRRVLTPSDDPIAAARALDVSQSLSTNEQYATNRKAAISKLSLEESVLTSVTTLIQDVKTVAINGGNPTLGDDNRNSLATELLGRYKELLGLANTTDGNGEFLFAGYRSGTLPFAETSPGNVAYSGDQGQQLIQIGATRQVAVTDAGVDVFQNIKNGNGSFVTAAASSNVGGGIVSAGAVLDPAKWALAPNKDFTIRFAGNISTAAGVSNTGTDNVAGGIVDQAAWNASSKSLQISVAAGGVAGTFDYTITDSALGSYVINYDPATQNPLTVKLNGAGGTFNAGVDLVLSGTAPAAGDTFTVTAAATPGWTYDIVNNVTGNSLLTGTTPVSPPYLRTYNSGSTISLSQTSAPSFDYGAQLSITGSPAGGDTFTVKASTNESLFTTINNLIQALQVPGGGPSLSNKLNTALTNLDNADSHILKIRASVGSRLKEIDTAQSLGEEVNVQYQQTLSGLMDVDYAAAISELTQRQSYLEAAQLSFTKVTQLSLFNYL